MPLHPSAGVKQQDGEAFAFRVEIRIARNVHPPVVGCLLRRVAQLQAFGCRTFAQGYNLVFVGLPVESERLNKLVQSGKIRRCVHGLLDGVAVKRTGCALSARWRARSVSSRSRAMRSPSKPAS